MSFITLFIHKSACIVQQKHTVGTQYFVPADYFPVFQAERDLAFVWCEGTQIALSKQLGHKTLQQSEEDAHISGYVACSIQNSAGFNCECAGALSQF